MVGKVMVTPELMEQVKFGAVLAVSVSGGKDSQALLNSVMSWYKESGLTNKIFAIHADLGRAEWKETSAHTAKICEAHGLELVTVQAEHEGSPIDLVDKIEIRHQQLKDSGRTNVAPFPSSMQRYCTSDMKIDPIKHYLRKFDRSINIMGIRWEESKSRAEKPIFERKEGMKKKGTPQGYTWNAIIHYTFADVLAACGMTEAQYKHGRLQYQLTETIPSDWSLHPAYAYGNDRLSCSICVLGSRSDVVNGVKHNPEYAQYLHEKEQETGFTFQQGFSIQKAMDRLKSNGAQTNMFNPK